MSYVQLLGLSSHRFSSPAFCTAFISSHPSTPFRSFSALKSWYLRWFERGREDARAADALILIEERGSAEHKGRGSRVKGLRSEAGGRRSILGGRGSKVRERTL
eukprot:1822004-Rhodomonas_salina.2